MAQILILWGLLILARDEYSPVFCATVYAIVLVFFEFISKYPNGLNTLSFVYLAIAFLFALLYFWLVKKTYGYPIFHWAVIIGGVLIGLV